ncbi:MAG: amino acid adenylation domain-containing protein [Nanoarchaeota archaeon]|nr:amino acid adenylation domain-containing protein [Nanoarchaeota archaeon]
MIYLLQDFISKNAKKYPFKLMIQDGDKTISYGEMDKFTNKFAQFLVLHGVKRGDRVCFHMKKSIKAFKSLISILKADSVYVPLNISTPHQRNQFILEDAQCKFIICDAKSFSKTLEMLDGFNQKIKIINIDSQSDTPQELDSLQKNIEVIFLEDLDKFSDQKREYQNIDLDLAYIIYTSGSTGLPKGVMISHKNVIDYSNWTVDFFKVDENDRLSNHPGLYFDLSTFDVYTAFKSGASLHLVPYTTSMFPIKVIEFIEKNKLTLWNSVPSLITFIAKSGVLKKGRMPSLKKITFCGEVMPTQTIIEWMKVYPHIKYVNQYGPTETTCASMYYEIKEIPTDPAKPIPIGTAIPNTEVFALKENNQKIDIEEVGELHIRGSGNGLGYWNNERLTQKSFVQNFLNNCFRENVYTTGDLVKLGKDGNYDFVGRKDNQIKYMGFRVELGEIESTLDSFDYVLSSAALGTKNSEIDGTIITAFVSLKNQVEILKIKEDLGKKIPHYMVPKEIIIVDKMPLNANGKIDRLSLKSYFKKERIKKWSPK